MHMLDLIDRYWKLFLDHEPAKYSRMNGPQAQHKYTDVLDWNGDRRPLPICPKDIADHLDGCRTYAVPLIGASGLSNKGAIELDHGGIDECRYVLDVAARLGYHGFAITSSNPIQGHDGGHLWFLFDDDTHPDRILAAMELIRDIAARLTKGCRHVLAALQEHTNALGDYLRGNAYLAQHLDLSIRTIRRHLRCLELRGLIEAQPRYGQTTIYRVCSSAHTAGRDDCARCPLSTDGICPPDDNQPETCVSVISGEPDRGGHLSALDNAWAWEGPEPCVSVPAPDNHAGMGGQLSSTWIYQTHMQDNADHPCEPAFSPGALDLAALMPATTPETCVSVPHPDNDSARGGQLSSTWIYQTPMQEDADHPCEPAPCSSAPDLAAPVPTTTPERCVSGQSVTDELLYGPAGAITYPGGAAYVPPGAPDAEAWYITQVEPSLACQQFSGADPIPEQLDISAKLPPLSPPAPERRTASPGRTRTAYRARLLRMKATELAGELIKWRRTEAKRGSAAWLRERIRDVEAEIDARDQPSNGVSPASSGPAAQDSRQVHIPIDTTASAAQIPPMPAEEEALNPPPGEPDAPPRVVSLPGTPARRAGSHALLRDDTDPWVRLQQSLLAQAERNGDSARAAFFRAVLAGDPLPAASHQRRRTR